MNHVVMVAAITHYKVYVEDDAGEKPTDQILKEAMERVLSGEADEDPEINLEDEDIVSAYIDYELFD